MSGGCRGGPDDCLLQCGPPRPPPQAMSTPAGAPTDDVRHHLPLVSTRNAYHSCSEMPCPAGIGQRVVQYSVAVLMALHPPKYQYAAFFSETLVKSRAELLWVPMFSTNAHYKEASRFLSMPEGHPASVEAVMVHHSGPLISSEIGRLGKTTSDVKKLFGVRSEALMYCTPCHAT